MDNRKWGIPKWSDCIVMPRAWAEDEMDPDKRGEFQIIHCGDAETAALVCGLLNDHASELLAASFPERTR